MMKVIHIRDAPAGWRNNPAYVFLGRPGKWGNPFTVKEYGRDFAIVKYRGWIRYHHALLADLHELIDITGVCFCKPNPCHGDVIAALVNNLPRDPEEDGMVEI